MHQHLLTRRSLLCGALSVGVTQSIASLLGQEKVTTKTIQTVRGPINADAMGKTLPHEHILCDFIGADSTGDHRWNRDEVFDRMLPYVQELKRAGVTTFIDCTPAFIGRDPVILSRLSKATKMNIITNTGFYGGADDKYVPKHAYQMSSEDMATHWIREIEHGIGDTGIRPGFLKIGHRHPIGK